jgi:fused signal recognition particle receptor
MFGFLRRKKPAEPEAAPAAGPAEVQTDPIVPSAGPAAAPAAPAVPAAPAAATAPIDTETSETPAVHAASGAAPPTLSPTPTPAEPPAPAARGGFWLRFIPGGRSAAESAPTPAGVEDGAAVTPEEAAEIEAQAAAAAEAAYEADERARTLQPAPQAAPAAAASPVVPAPPITAVTPAPDAPVALVPAPLPDRKPWLARLKQGLSRTSGNLAGLFIGVRVDEALFEELETALITSDTGVETTAWLLAGLRERVRRDRITDPMLVKAALRALLVELLAPLERPIDIDRAEPLVLMITGVNGAGKTTSIGKLARHLRREGKTVLLAAGDTFRAAAREQLAQWGSRNEVEVISQQGGDPAAVAFDAVSAGIARRTGVVMVDTAGRLPTQTHLMDELRKIRRVTAKAMAGAPHEVLLVLDGNTGQNMLAQVKSFDDAVQLTGLVVTKLDGTAKGGALAALAHTRRDRPIPVYFIGVGEGIDDLQAFSADEFAAALVD